MTRQRENILVALENWELVKQYAETGADSAGTAMEKFEITLDSVASKQEQLNAKMQEFYMNILNSGLITGLLDIGKALMDFINLGNGLVGKLGLLTIATVAWLGVLKALKGMKFTGLIAQFFAVAKAEGVATASGKALNVVLNTLKAHPIIFAISALIGVFMAVGSAIDAHNEKMQESIDKANELTEAYKSTSKELGDKLTNLETPSDTNRYKDLQEEFNYLTEGVDKYGNNLKLSNEEYARYKSICEQIVGLNPDLMEGYESETEAIGNKNTALSSTIDLLKEEARLEAKKYADSSGEVWQGAKAKWDENATARTGANGIIKFTQKEAESQKLGKTALETASRYLFQPFKDDYASGTMSMDDINKITSKYVKFSTEEIIREYLQNGRHIVVEGMTKALQDGVIDQDLYGSFLRDYYIDSMHDLEVFKNAYGDAYVEALRVVEDGKDELANSMDEVYKATATSADGFDDLNGHTKHFLMEYVTENFDIDENTTQAMIDKNKSTIEDMVESLSADTSEAKAVREKMSELFTIDPSTITYGDYRKQIDALAEEISKVTGQDKYKIKVALGFEANDAYVDDIDGLDDIGEKLQSKFGETKDEVDKKLQGMSKSAIDALLTMDESLLQSCKSWDDLAVAIQSVSNGAGSMETIFGNYAKEIQSMSEQYEILTKAQEEYNEYGNITASTMNKIIDNGLLEYLTTQNGQLQFNTQALQENANSARDNAIAKLQEALFTDLCSIANGTYQESLDATDETNANTALKSFQTELGNTTTKALETATAISAVNSAVGTDYSFSDEQKKQADAVVANYNAMVSKVNAITSNLASGTYRSGGSGGSKSKKEWWETQLEKLKDQLDYNVITMDTYISGVEKVLGKLKKGTEAWNKVNDELQKAKLDRLENQFDRGEISIDWYITKLTELRKAYKKGTEGYKELTKTINDTKLDAIESKFDRGEYSYDYYITKLKEIRSEYAKTTEDYKELTKTINDATLENLGNKYERGEISYSDYITQLNTLRQSYAKTTEEYKEISATITETAIENFDKQMDKIEERMSQLGDVNTDKERVEYAQLLAQKYKTVSDRIEFIRKEMQKTGITAEQRLLLEENLNELLEEQIDLRDEIEDEVREYYENQKEQAEQQAELNRKELLYRKELELYGNKGKELYEWETNQKIKALEEQIELREAERDALEEVNEREELENDLLEAKLKLQNALNNKTTKVLKKQADGTWQYEYSANMVDVKTAQDELKDAEKALDDYEFEQSIQELQDEADKLNENMEDLAEKYEEAEFWADREYEQTMNGIEKAYGDIDALVEKWMDKYGDSTTELTTSYQSLVSANVKLEDALTQLTTAINSKYETVGTNKVSSVDGVQSFDTGGKIVGNGLILAHDKERVLTERQNISFENFIAKIPQLLKAFDVTRFDGLISGKIAEAKVNSDKVNSTVISKVECVFPNITSTDGLQRAILDLPRLALQKK